MRNREEMVIHPEQKIDESEKESKIKEQDLDDLASFIANENQDIWGVSTIEIDSCYQTQEEERERLFYKLKNNNIDFYHPAFLPSLISMAHDHKESEEYSRMKNLPSAEDKYYEMSQRAIDQRMTEIKNSEVSYKGQKVKFKNIIPQDVGEISELIKDKTLFEQVIIFENAIKNESLLADDAEKLLEESKDNKMKVALMENLYHFSDSEERNKAIKILLKYLKNKKPYKNNKNKTSICRNIENIEIHYLNCLTFEDKKLLDTQDTKLGKYHNNSYYAYDNKIIKSSAIHALEKFGIEAEDEVLKAIEYLKNKTLEKNDNKKYKDETCDKISPNRSLNSSLYLLYKNSGHKTTEFLSEKLKDESFNKLLDYDYWHYSHETREYIEKILSEDASYSAHCLLKNSKDLKNEDKELFLNFLYRLELGKINISEDVVEYLEKQYKLKNYQEGGVAFRATAQGDIIILDKKGKVVGYFKLTELDSDEKRIETEMMLFSYQTLFFEKKNETKEERAKREGYLKEFQNNYFKIYGSNFFDKTGIQFNNLSFKEQGWFLIYSNKIKDDKEKKRELLNFAENYGENGIKAFLSLEFSEDNGKKIVDIGNKIEKWQSHIIFSNISELVDMAQKKNEELSRIIFKNNKKEFSTSIQIELLQKAHSIIKRFSDELKNEDKIDQKQIEKLLADLEQSRIEIDLVASLLIASKKEGEAQNLEDIKGLKIDEVEYTELDNDPKLWNKLKNMYRTRNAGKSEEDLARLASAFEEHQKFDPKFYLMYFDQNSKMPEKNLNNLVGFIRSSSFDGERELSEDERYLGGMNIDPLLQKFYLGENFLREAVEKEFADGAEKIIAHVPENSASHKACLALGFENIGFEGSYKDDNGKEYAKRVKIGVNKENFRKLQDEFSLKEAA